MDLKGLQRQVAAFDERAGWTADTLEQTVLHLAEETGEISREILRAGGYKAGDFDREALAGELVDALYLIAKLANHTGIDLEQSWARMESRHQAKL